MNERYSVCQCYIYGYQHLFKVDNELFVVSAGMLRRNYIVTHNLQDFFAGSAVVPYADFTI